MVGGGGLEETKREGVRGRWSRKERGGVFVRVCVGIGIDGVG